MEQLGIDWKLLGAQILNFIILLYLLKRFVFGHLFATLHARRKKIEEGVHKTEEASQKLQQLQESERKAKERQEREAKELLRRAREEARQKEEQVLQAAQEEKKRREEKAQKELQEELARRKAEFDAALADYAFAITEKFLGEKTGSQKDRKMITDLLKKSKKAV